MNLQFNRRVSESRRSNKTNIFYLLQNNIMKETKLITYHLKQEDIREVSVSIKLTLSFVSLWFSLPKLSWALL